MKKSILAMLLLAVAMLTGCSAEQRLKINADFSSSTEMDLYTAAEEESAIMQSLAEMGMTEGTTYADLMKEMEFTYKGAQMVDGVLNNVYTSTSKSNAKDTKASFVELNMNRAVYDIAQQAESVQEQASATTQNDLSDMGFFYMVITYPFEVGKANGEIQADGRTVKYDVKALQLKKVDRLYAVSKKALAAKDQITIKGAKNNKAYKKAVTVQVSAKSAVVSFKVNGKAQMTNKFSANKNGKYKVVVKSATGKSKTINFCIDKKKPTTNIKNNKTYKKAVKITFKDSISGIKKATLNGKKIKSGKKVSKNGKYTLKIYDKAGNVKTVKFTIKK